MSITKKLKDCNIYIYISEKALETIDDRLNSNYRENSSIKQQITQLSVECTNYVANNENAKGFNLTEINSIRGKEHDYTNELQNLYSQNEDSITQLILFIEEIKIEFKLSSV